MKQIIFKVFVLLICFGNQSFGQNLEVEGDGYISGNVGIGISSPSSKLQVGDLLGSAGNVYITVGSAGGNTSISGLKLRHFSDDFGFTIESNDIPGFQGFNIRRHIGNSEGISDMFIDPFGNVGFGTMSPSQKLDVNGNLNVAGIISGVSDPISQQDAATKIYVDNVLLSFGVSLGIAGIQGLLNAGYTPLEIMSNGASMSDFIGLNYAGGIIFYMNPSGDGTGLVAAPSYQSSGAWGCAPGDLPSVPNVPDPPSGPGAEIGDGITNTAAILEDCPTAPAALACANYMGGGFNDWFLPSIKEFDEMYMNIGPGATGVNENIGGFTSTFHWSSSEFDNISAWTKDFFSGGTTLSLKPSTPLVRAIRAF